MLTSERTVRMLTYNVNTIGRVLLSSNPRHYITLRNHLLQVLLNSVLIKGSAVKFSFTTTALACELQTYFQSQLKPHCLPRPWHQESFLWKLVSLPGVTFINEDRDYSEPTSKQRKTEKYVMCMEEETTEDTVLVIAGSLKSVYVTCLCRHYHVSNTCLCQEIDEEAGTKLYDGNCF